MPDKKQKTKRKNKYIWRMKSDTKSKKPEI